MSVFSRLCGSTSILAKNKKYLWLPILMIVFYECCLSAYRQVPSTHKLSSLKKNISRFSCNSTRRHHFTRNLSHENCKEVFNDVDEGTECKIEDKDCNFTGKTGRIIIHISRDILRKTFRLFLIYDVQYCLQDYSSCLKVRGYRYAVYSENIDKEKREFMRQAILRRKQR